MRAWKFLDGAGRAIFSGYSWPLPEDDRPGPWLEAGAAIPCRSGVHACRPSDVAWWIHDELWEVELGGDVIERPHKVVATRGRLVRRVEAWSAGASKELGEASAWRARDLAVTVLTRHGFEDVSEGLRAASDLQLLQTLGTELSDSLGPLTAAGLASALAGDAAYFARAGEPCQAPYVAACARGHADSLSGSYHDGFAVERARQSEWIASRLGLPDVHTNVRSL